MTFRASKIAHAGEWPQHAAIDSLTLDYDRRHRRRIRYSSPTGTEILLDLPETILLREGDALILDEGGYVAIHAAPENLLEITTNSPDSLTRLAWHLGNRHLSVEFLPNKLRILTDHVIAAMLPALSATVIPITAPFNPEPGAYHHG